RIQRYTRAEERLAGEAAQAFTSREYGKAADRYAALVAEYPRAIRASEYRFFAELSKVRRQTALVPPASEDALAELVQFVHDHEGGPFLKDKRLDVFESALKTLDDLAAEGKEALADRKPD